jgi:hypothetical protein
MGCYRYVPREMAALPANAEVAVDLSPTGSNNVRPSIGDGVSVVEGRLTNIDSSGLTLSLSMVRRRFDGPSTWNGETLQLSRGDYDRVREKQLSRGRTTAAAVGFGALGVGLLVAIAKATGILFVSGSGKGPIPPP